MSAVLAKDARILCYTALDSGPPVGEKAEEESFERY
jgi:hypothetical protein